MGVVKRYTGTAWATATVQKRAAGAWSAATATLLPVVSSVPAPTYNFDFHEGSGTKATTVGGTAFLTAVTPTTAWSGQAAAGSFTWATSPPFINGGTPATLAFDFRLNQSYPSSVIGLMIIGGNGWSYLGLNNGVFYFKNDAGVINSSFTPSISTTYRCVVTCSATGAWLVYMNGAQVLSVPAGGQMNPYGSFRVQPNNGIVDDVKFWNGTCLSAAQVAALSGGPPPPPPPPPPPVVPTITSIVPNPGPAGQVTVNGTGFVSGATVSFGGTAATNVIVSSATQLSCTAPAHANGPVNVTVTTSGGVSNTVVFTYQTAPPPPPPPPGGFPNRTNTGVPAGVVLTTYTGNYTAQAGQTVTGLHITGELIVAGANVTVRNCAIDQGFHNDKPNLLVEDCYLGPLTTGPYCPSGRIIGDHDYTMRRCQIRGTNEGPAIFFGGGPVVLEDCLVELKDAQDGNHCDSIQGVQGGNNARLIHNTFNALYCDLSPGGSANSGIFWSDSSGNGLVVQNNLWLGGGYTIRIHDGTGHTFTGNSVVNGAWKYGPVFSNCANITWNNNTLVTVDSTQLGSNYQVTSVVGPMACNSVQL